MAVDIRRTPASEARNEWSFQKNGRALKPKDEAEALKFVLYSRGTGVKLYQHHTRLAFPDTNSERERVSDGVNTCRRRAFSERCCCRTLCFTSSRVRFYHFIFYFYLCGLGCADFR